RRPARSAWSAARSTACARWCATSSRALRPARTSTTPCARSRTWWRWLRSCATRGAAERGSLLRDARRPERGASASGPRRGAREGRALRLAARAAARGRRRRDQPLREQARAQREEVEMAALRAEPLEDRVELRGRIEPQQLGETPARAHVAGREHVEPAEPAQEDEPGAPGTDARQRAQHAHRLVALERGDRILA